MTEIDIDSVSKVYFVGIGGIGMSASAGIARQAGFAVSGSDSAEVYDPAKAVLDQEHIPYHRGYDSAHITEALADLYILSSGEDLKNPEVSYIYEHELPHMSFAKFLSLLAKDSLRVVVAGTHGKSTTAGLLGHMLKNLDDSSFMTGAVLKNYDSNFYYGEGNYFVFEGDEYKSEWDDPTPKFQYYKPDILLLNNLEYDHPDLFSSMKELEDEFAQLIASVPPDGLIVYNADDIIVSRLVHESNVSSVSFGVDSPADYRAEEIHSEDGYTTMEVKNKFSRQISARLLEQPEQYKTQLPGKMNAYNALGVIATLRALGFQQEQIALELLSYQGVKRRFEVVGVKNGITLVDDYAHHPTAVKKTLEAARERYPGARIWAIFEPHTYSRTEATLEDLSSSFNSADQVIISKIYAAREKARPGTITSEAVVAAIRERRAAHFPETGAGVRLVQSKEEALEILRRNAKSGDVIITMAVGDFNRLPYELKEIL